ncbi:hypothetical protein NEUTE1DRAFT_109739 [Neurospora tetrasperma FGSC 2508]|uniref:Uncharacterized protein n=1 Tax=Neurospora tetrasperma (strain FGSC 2508 / ATCC MYA-4615 / P0657) TaxID=510951 RepID=F8MKX5_NEUT8|nr:uncharacterized protein NEUTE1DRAFT_109739 [Neurospora tetrasperma FGSC 2508]EGO57503.1 hypothetical protein NEUTE1DRAFT_109739 [Neurospora tetrasperma FGSC 2508]
MSPKGLMAAPQCVVHLLPPSVWPFCATKAAQVFHVVSGSDLMLKGELGPKVVVIMVVFQGTGKWFRSRSRCQRDVVPTSREVDVWGGVATAMSICVAVDDAVMDGVVVNGGNCSVRGELPTVVPSPATGQIYVKGTEFGDGRQCNRPAGVRQIPCKFHPCWPMCVQKRFSSKVPVLLFVRVETAKQIVNSLNVNFNSAAICTVCCMDRRTVDKPKTLARHCQPRWWQPVLLQFVTAEVHYTSITKIRLQLTFDLSVLRRRPNLRSQNLSYTFYANTRVLEQIKRKLI